jgi:DNA-binding MarR family transcriptional regulator
LSTRLKELELAGVVERRPSKTDRGIFEYHLTEAGKDLRPVIEAIGTWGQKWVESSIPLKNLDPLLLMWDMRRNLNPAPLPPIRTAVQFLCSDLSSTKNRW